MILQSMSLSAVVFALVMILMGCGGGNGSTPVDSTNTPPVADAGIDQVIKPGSQVTLDGSSSADEDGQIVSYHWVQTRGTHVTLSNARIDSPYFIAPQTSTREQLDFLLTVQDNEGAQSTDAITITVNIPPTVDAADQALSLSGIDTQNITMTGTVSDSDGAVVAHQWVQTGGPPVVLAGAETPAASFTVPATTTVYTFSYTVTDNDGARATDTVSVYVTRIIFWDTFSDGEGWTGRWTTVDETGKGADWVAATAGQLVQRKNLSKGEFLNATSYHLGTFAILNPSPSDMSGSYYFSADVKPLPDTSGYQGNDVGIMFRYIDPLNYYRVSMNALFGFTRFEKRENGIFETLAVSAIGYVDNQPMSMAAEVNGETIIVWIDGEPVFAVADKGISSGTVGLYCQDSAEFDNILITENTLQPKVVLSTPLAYSVALTEDNGDTLSAEAIVLNKPVGGRVEFTLLNPDNGSKATKAGTDNISVHSAAFSGFAAGEHELMAVLKDAAGRQVSRDTNSAVGIGGDYIVTVGDSITNGVGDQNPLNNESADGRILAVQGYQAVLSDLMTTATGRPQIVYNEGIGGDRASNLKGRIDSILERHPGANKVLLMIGSNDADAGVPPDTFETNVLAIVGKMKARYVWIAKPMPTFIKNSPIPWTPDAIRNDYIQQYNDKIDQIAENDSNIFLGPDFYAVFNDRIDLYGDYVHPNDAGYAVMADQWRVVLAP